MSDSQQLHGLQHTRLLHPWDFSRQEYWSGVPFPSPPISLRIFQFVVIHIVKGFGEVDKAEVDVYLELSYFFYDPVDVGYSISGSSMSSKSCSYIWNFLVHVLLKPRVKDFEPYPASK